MSAFIDHNDTRTGARKRPLLSDPWNWRLRPSIATQVLWALIPALITLVVFYRLAPEPLPYAATLVYTALHETGHALLAAIDGWAYVEIVVNGDGSGHVQAANSSAAALPWIAAAGFVLPLWLAAVLISFATRRTWARMGLAFLGLWLALLGAFQAAIPVVMSLSVVGGLLCLLAIVSSAPEIRAFTAYFVAGALIVQSFLARNTLFSLETASGAASDTAIIAQFAGFGSLEQWAWALVLAGGLPVVIVGAGMANWVLARRI